MTPAELSIEFHFQELCAIRFFQWLRPDSAEPAVKPPNWECELEDALELSFEWLDVPMHRQAALRERVACAVAAATP